jgi:hypothetical protein
MIFGCFHQIFHYKVFFYIVFGTFPYKTQEKGKKNVSDKFDGNLQ